jgi:putative nucleotidyltransferase with HDIG domain
MANTTVADSGGQRFSRGRAMALLVIGLPACVVGAAAQIGSDRAADNSLAGVLLLAAVIAGVLVVPLAGKAEVTASYLVVMLAAAFLGPASACGAAIVAELAATLWSRNKGRLGLASNLLAVMFPALLAGDLFRIVIPPGSHDSIGFYGVFVAGGVLYLAVNFVLASAYNEVITGRHVLTLDTLRAHALGLALNLVLAVAGTAVYLRLGLSGIAFVLSAVFAFSYMAQLVERARARSEQYVSLSWGVLAGLMRSLDIRDQRTARHSAAVARFARDIAQAIGMSDADCELAHTAGLLHDIGRFALSDRVAERGRTLTEEDWVAIQRHPELGADMLRDLGMYGPVAEIVLAHHERIDGRGYPSRLSESEIPEIAKIISVAEVYDTLTASDTYRTRMSSFEALTELRRVAGTQVDARYVEVLAGLLTGEGVEYRHADRADFDVELDMERRIKEAGAGG